MASEQNSYPDKYWHCLIELKRVGAQKPDSSVINDMTFEQLKTQILTPWLANKRFVANGLVVSNVSEIQSIKISHTTQSQAIIAQQYNQRTYANGIADMVTDRTLLPFGQGTDFTHQLLFSQDVAPHDSSQVSLVLELCKRLKKSASIITNRTRKDKVSYTINDEYDVQDLLHALIRGFIKYSVQEDPISKLAGVKSSRADISIEELGVLIEIKYVRSPDDQKKIVSDYSQDLLLYTRWPHLRTLIFLVYNSDDLSDPEALEKLSGKQLINGVEFLSQIILS